MKEKDFGQFVKEVKDILEATAREKGYNTAGTESNEIYEFVQKLTSSDDHAIGELIYKVVRFKNKGDKRDLAKIAAWAYLIWKFGY